MTYSAKGLQDAAAAMANYTESKARVDLANPANSLLLTKPLTTRGDVLHEGGKSYIANEMAPEYQRWFKWVQCGAKFEAVPSDACTGGATPDMAGGG